MKILLVIVAILSSLSCFAQEFSIDELVGSGYISAEQAHQIKLENKIESLMLKMAEEDFIAHPNLSPQDLDNAEYWNSHLQKKARRILEAYAESENLSAAATQDIVREVNRRINWDKLRRVIQKLFVKFKRIWRFAVGKVRLNGYLVGITYTVSSALNYAVPALIIAPFNPALAGIVAASPLSTIATSTHLLFQNKAVQMTQKKLLGADVFNEIQEIKKEARVALGGKGGEDLFMIFKLDEEIVSVNTGTGSWFNRVKGKLGFSDNFNYKSLKNFALENEVFEQFITRLDATRLTNEHKLLILLTQMKNSGSQEFLWALKNRFKDSFKVIHQIPNWHKSSSWFLKTCNSTNMAEFYENIRSFPRDIPPKQFARIWREIVMPELANNLKDVPYFSFRKLVKQFNELEASFLASDASSFSHAQAQNYFKYIDSSLVPRETCFHFLSSLLH